MKFKIKENCSYTIQELVGGNIFFWRVPNSDSYRNEIRFAIGRGYKVAETVGEGKRGVWIVSGTELLKYLEVRSQEFQVIKVRK